jgi:hypothetical protein
MYSMLQGQSFQETLTVRYVQFHTLYLLPEVDSIASLTTETSSIPILAIPNLIINSTN